MIDDLVDEAAGERFSAPGYALTLASKALSHLSRRRAAALR